MRSLERLNALGARLSCLWEARVVTARDRKRLFSCLVEEVVLWRDSEEKMIRILVRWHGGVTDEYELPSHQAPEVACDNIETVELVRRLAEHYPDSRTAVILNRQGRRTIKGLPFTKYLVSQLRVRHAILAYRGGKGDLDAPMLSIAEAAKELKTTAGTLYRWVREGTASGERVHSFRTLLDDLATVANNRVVAPLADAKPCDVITRPSALQRKAFKLLGVRLERTQ